MDFNDEDSEFCVGISKKDCRIDRSRPCPSLFESLAICAGCPDKITEFEKKYLDMRTLLGITSNVKARIDAFDASRINGDCCPYFMDDDCKFLLTFIAENNFNFLFEYYHN